MDERMPTPPRAQPSLSMLLCKLNVNTASKYVLCYVHANTILK